MKVRKTYVLEQSPLYKLTNRKRLAHKLFNVDIAFLEKLAGKGDENFRVFDVVQGKKKRQVEVPKPMLERVHRRLFTLLDRIEKPAYLQSGVKGRSYITNAKVHVGEVPLVKLDIKKFYPSIDRARVYRFFFDILKCSPDVAALLSKLTTCGGHVPTGSCVSQLLAFFAAKPMFDEIESLALGQAARFSCYVDDMTFSGTRATPALLWTVKQIVHRHGFQYHKDHCYTVSQRKLVTGVMIDGDRVAVLPSREHDLWRQTQALGSGDINERRRAVTSLIGVVVAAGQIEPRLLARLKRLRAIGSTVTPKARSA